MLNGIDVSSHNDYPFNAITEAGYRTSDFVIVKATQGTSYINPYCDKAVQRCINDGKLWGFYHYASGGNPESEAEYFYNQTKNYTGKGIPALDWESIQNRAWGNTTWCKRFVDRYYQLTKVYPLIYIQASSINQAANCSDKCGLWVASYQSKLTWNLYPWQTYTVWQYTSSNGKLDKNKANLTKEAWLKIAQGNRNASDKTDNSELDKALEVIARAVIAGKFLNGSARKNMIYEAVQKKVNELLKEK